MNSKLNRPDGRTHKLEPEKSMSMGGNHASHVANPHKQNGARQWESTSNQEMLPRGKGMQATTRGTSQL
jgi:hypothetical protein